MPVSRPREDRRSTWKCRVGTASSPSNTARSGIRRCAGRRRVMPSADAARPCADPPVVADPSRRGRTRPREEVATAGGHWRLSSLNKQGEHAPLARRRTSVPGQREREADRPSPESSVGSPRIDVDIVGSRRRGRRRTSPSPMPSLSSVRAARRAVVVGGVVVVPPSWWWDRRGRGGGGRRRGCSCDVGASEWACRRRGRHRCRDRRRRGCGMADGASADHHCCAAVAADDAAVVSIIGIRQTSCHDAGAS